MKTVIFFTFCFVFVVTELLAGGWSKVYESKAEIQEIADRIKDQVESKLTVESFPEFIVVSYRMQVVAGMNYLLKINIGDSYIHVKLYHRLDDSLILTKVETGKTLNDPLDP